jgi:hypothetical protein
MKFLVKFIRPTFESPLKFIFFLITLFQVIFIKGIRDNYVKNTKLWKDICNISKLNSFFRDIKYKEDGPYGIMDHDNSRLEFFTSYGDCDDMGRYSYEKLKELGIKAHRIFIQGKNIFSNHFDCLFELNNNFFLFNYGNNKLLNKNDLNESIIFTLNSIYKNSTFKFLNKEYPIQFKNWFYLN